MAREDGARVGLGAADVRRADVGDERRRVALQISSFLVAPQLVAESDLVSTGPELLLRRVSARLPIVLRKAPLPLPRFELCLVWHTRRAHDPAHVWMREVVVRAARAALDQA